VWPNLCAAAKKASVPMILANARLNEKSQRQALRLAWLARPAYASFSQVLAQTDDDAQRLRSVGAREAQVLGNVKYDVVPPADLMRVGEQFKLIAPSKRVVLLTSSREGEETLFLEQIRPIAGLNTAQGAINSIASTLHEDIQWMIVPRHPQRFDEVQRLIEQAGLNVSRRSTWGDAPKDADVWLGDTMGEMTLYYALADIALLGGSFAPLGGQNLIEAIAAGCPVVMGPHTFNFDEACNTAEREGAALRCTDMAQAVALAARTVPNSHAMQKLKHQGEDWLYASRGASRQMATVIAQLLKP
jgi:3-deoxy-D-manno-octulosonic-acid transferase